ncbi:unnamed protein product, partial [Prorocentrum cordatum]
GGSVAPEVLERCQSGVAGFTTFAGFRELVSDEQVDSNLVDYFNQPYFRGWGAKKGGQILAGLVCPAPEFPRFGVRQLPRACRCLKGWMRRALGRCRRGWLLASRAGIGWCGVACRGRPPPSYRAAARLG